MHKLVAVDRLFTQLDQFHGSDIYYFPHQKNIDASIISSALCSFVPKNLTKADFDCQ